VGGDEKDFAVSARAGKDLFLLSRALPAACASGSIRITI